MRSICLAAAFLGLLAPCAQAAELTVLAPGFVANAGLQDLAASFTKETGIKVTVKGTGMGAIVSEAKTGTPPPDLVVLPSEPYDLMGNFAMDKGIIPGTWTPLGRIEIVLVTRADQPKPDISTVAKLAAVLKSSTGIRYSNPGTDRTPGAGSMEALVIDNLLKRPEFVGVKTVVAGGRGAAAPAVKGDMALQLVCEVDRYLPELTSAGPLPPELYAHMDGAIAISKRTADEKDARAFIAYITRAEATSVWKAKGLDRF